MAYENWTPKKLPSDVVEDSDGGDAFESRVPTFGLHLGKGSPWDKTQQDSRCDSGICDSFMSSTTSSCRSSYADSYTAESLGVDGEISEQFHALNIDPKEHSQVKRLPSIDEQDRVDEGFFSTDKDSSLRLSSDLSQSKIVFPPELPAQVKQEEPEIDDRILDIFVQDEDGDTQLHMAIIQLQPQVALKMIMLCPDACLLAIQNTLGQTPLHLAVITKQPEVVRKLVAMGAPLELRDRHGNTALHLASREGDLVSVQALTIPLTSVEEHQLRAFSLPVPTVSQGTHNLWNYEGETCLHLALLRGHKHIIAYLVSPYVHADINIKDGRSGRTVLHYAVESGNLDLIRFLVHDCRANVNSSTFDGSTPLKLAAGRQFLPAANLLVSAGADESALHMSSSEESDESDDDMFEEVAGSAPILSS